MPGSLIAAGLLLGGCAESPSMLDPHGLGAERIGDLWWLMFWLGLAVYVLVIGLLFFAMFRRRDTHERRPLNKTWFVVIGAVVMPAIVLLVVLVATVLTEQALNRQASEPALRIRVVGYQFWWDVRYPDQGIVTANEIHVPVGQSVRLELESADVIHSFWVPQLHGKLDMFPGRTTTITINARDPGVYRGECAEFCGIQHAHMAFVVVALPPEDFAAWVASHREPPPPPGDPLVRRGQEVFQAYRCTYCHAVRGIPDVAGRNNVAPDLTYLARRNTLAAGTLDNNAENLAAWIVNPQSIKPGSAMPASSLTEEELQALLAFLATLD